MQKIHIATTGFWSLEHRPHHWCNTLCEFCGKSPQLLDKLSYLSLLPTFPVLHIVEWYAEADILHHLPWIMSTNCQPYFIWYPTFHISASKDYQCSHNSHDPLTKKTAPLFVTKYITYIHAMCYRSRIHCYGKPKLCNSRLSLTLTILLYVEKHMEGFRNIKLHVKIEEQK
jgi:hypothetical protein